MKSRVFLTIPIVLFALALGFLPFLSASAQSAPKIATLTVTALGRKDAAPTNLTRDDVQLSVANERKQIASWTKGGKLYLAILIDDSLDTTAASQWTDLRAFINAQPADTWVAVGYADNSTVVVAQDFTQDRAAAANALRIPRGAFSGGSSPYLSVIDWIKRWPATSDRSSLLLISSGIDYLRGDFGPVYPDVDTAISLAQKHNINLWSIYYPGSGHLGRSFFLMDKAQLNLSKLTLEAGGESFYLGFAPPVAIGPYLDELQTHLSNQYLLSFAGDGGQKGKFLRPSLRTEVAGVEFLYANQAWLPPSR
jgi:hypothetical protein